LSAEATRLDRSQSWLVQQCLKRSLSEMAKLAPDSDTVAAMKRSPLRNPIRLQSLRVNVALAVSDDPVARELATTPKGTEQRTFYLPSDLYTVFDREGERLGLSADEILMWAWEQNKDEIRALRPVGE